MKTGHAATALVAVVCFAAGMSAQAPPPSGGRPIASLSYGSGNADTSYRVPQRVVKGKVLDTHGTTLQNTTVYLKDQQTKQVRTMLPAKDGSYLFGGLPLSHDYEVWAQLGPAKSRVQQVSSFITTMDVTADLKLDPAAAAAAKETPAPR